MQGGTNGSKEESSKEEDSKEEGSKEEGSKEEDSKEEDSKEEGSKEEGSKEEDSKEESSKEEDSKEEKEIVRNSLLFLTRPHGWVAFMVSLTTMRFCLLWVLGYSVFLASLFYFKSTEG
jgi:hypothetical protein